MRRFGTSTWDRILTRAGKAIFLRAQGYYKKRSLSGKARKAVLLASAGIKSPAISFGIRLPNGLAPSFPRPMATVSHWVILLCKAWISNFRQKRAGKQMSSLCSSTIQSKGKYGAQAFV
jgi:hypothetical protein